MSDWEDTNLMELHRAYQNARAKHFIKPTIERLNETGELDCDPEEIEIEWPLIPSVYCDEEGNVIFKRTDIGENDD